VSGPLPTWTQEGLKYLGQREIPGVQHSGFVLSLWRAIKRGGIKDDETPWCSAYVGAMLEAVGIVSTRFEGAKSYLDYGIRLDKPYPGCIAVIERPGGWHVGFVLGMATNARPGDPALALLGGNQGNAVSVISVPLSSIKALRWPPRQPLPSTTMGVYGGAGSAGSMA